MIQKIDNLVIEKYLADNLLIVQYHPTLDLRVLNYSVKTQWGRLWDEITLSCRSLVVDGEGNIVARCMPKFFNYSELSENGIEIPNLPFKVFTKEDGSLIQVFSYKGEIIVCSRGSFISDHVGWANKILHKKYALQYETFVYWAKNNLMNETFVFELIVPQNRIVVNYGDKEDLILLAVIENKTGKEKKLTPDFMKFSVVKEYDGITNYDKLKEIIGDNEEGFIVQFSNGFRMKIKGDEYCRLHKMMTNLNSNDIWKAYRARTSFYDFVAPLPDEMFGWIKGVWDEISVKLSQKVDEFATEYWKIYRECLVKQRLTDKDVAEEFKKSKNYHKLLAYHKNFSLLIEQILEEYCKPEFQKSWI